ncbi:MAG: hypothetical protein K0R54_389 [Clostridiaceae bacterium]|jgi:hypothetical protein|nr:hypothetical protein [Clostridiaceae bacterium]
MDDTFEKMKKVNNSFIAPDNMSIARYINFTELIDLLETEELHFTDSHYFEDDYEGEIPINFFKGWSEESKKNYLNLIESIKDIRNVYVNCWNKFESESYALWKIYTNPKNGICIKSTVGKLRKSLQNKNIEIYRVKYIDSYKDMITKTEPAYYYREDRRSGINTRIMETLKFKPYDYENEVRAVYVDYSKDYCKRFKVNLNLLIENIFVSPFAPDWFYNLVEKIVWNRYKIDSNVIIKRSDIRVAKY